MFFRIQLTVKALIQQFGTESDVEIYSQAAISDCFQVLDSKEVDYAVVPFENSTNGQVVYTYDLLRDWYIPSSQDQNNDENQHIAPKFRIVGEQFVSIHHNFLSNAKTLDDITTIYSHPQVRGQVTKFLSKHITKNITKLDSDSTSKAAEIVNNDKSGTSACISSKISADLYQLPILFENIENSSNNTTRFLVLGYDEINSHPLGPENDSHPKAYVTSIIFTLDHDDPGALCAVLDTFKKNNINLTSINSRPSHLKQWQYVFFVELVGSIDDENISASINSLSSNCLTLEVLGSFQRCWRYWSEQ